MREIAVDDKPNPLNALPYITDDLHGISGKLKQDPGHFRVSEIPLYSPRGEGQHLYIRCTREGMTTRELEKRLRTLFDLPKVAMGHAGLKDKHARVTQTISLDLPNADPEEVWGKIAGHLPVEVAEVKRHRNKLKPGHLAGNAFRIIVTGMRKGEPALDRAEAIAERLVDRGFPNFFGSQRFGRDGDNAERGKEILRGDRRVRGRWLRQLLLHSYQSALFNRWLARRIGDGFYHRILDGDIAKVAETGGLFAVDDPENAQRRFDEREISYTGPLYGEDLWAAERRAGERELQILEEEGVTCENFGEHRISGNRRRAVVFPGEIKVNRHPEGLALAFTLPKGAYATVVMREFLKDKR